MAWINNVTEIRLDAFQICTMHRRPAWRIQEDIGSWMAVLNFMSLVNVVTNACLIAFVGAQLAPGTNSFIERFMKVELWMTVVAVEHAVLLIKIMIQVMVPSQPEWIDDEKDLIAVIREETLQPLIDADNSEKNKLPKFGIDIANAALAADDTEVVAAAAEPQRGEVNVDVDERLLRVWKKVRDDSFRSPRPRPSSLLQCHTMGSRASNTCSAAAGRCGRRRLARQGRAAPSPSGSLTHAHRCRCRC